MKKKLYSLDVQKSKSNAEMLPLLQNMFKWTMSASQKGQCIGNQAGIRILRHTKFFCKELIPATMKFIQSQ